MPKRTRLTARTAKQFTKSLPERIRRASTEVGRAIAKGIEKEVKAHIPLDEWWEKFYVDSIKYLESADGTEWAVAGLSPTKLTRVPAETSQVMFEGATPIARVMRSNNPWTVDLIPAIAGGYALNAEVRPASASEVASHRKRIQPEIADIKKQLQEAGATVVENEFPVIAGKVFVDLVFLGKRLELGLGGFRRTPHWLKAVQAARSRAGRWIDEKARSRIRAVLRGERLEDRGEKMDPALQKRLERRRRTTWP